MGKKTKRLRRADELALLIKHHTFIINGERMILRLDTLGKIEGTKHLKDDKELIYKLRKLIHMVNDDPSLLEKDVQDELWYLL